MANHSMRAMAYAALLLALLPGCRAGQDVGSRQGSAPSGVPVNDGNSGAQNPNLSTGVGAPSGTTALPWPASLCPNQPLAAAPFSITPQVKTLVQNIDGADWSEGPVWLPGRGMLIFGAAATGQDDAQSKRTALYSVTPPADIPQPLAAAGTVRSNGLATDPNGLIWATVHGTVRGLVTFTPEAPATQTTILDGLGGRAFNAPNDLTRHLSGAFFFTDPNYEQANRDGQPATGVYLWRPDGQVTAIDVARNQPNGIALSPDHTWLYVGGLDKKILRYPVAADATCGAATMWVETDSNIDGMAVDCAGNIYASLNDVKAVAIYTPNGVELGRVALPFAPSNLAFGGSDSKTLYITGGGGLYSIPVAIPGLPF